MTATVQWASDPAAESRVKRLGGTMTVLKGIPIKEIDIHGSRANNARLDTPFKEELALEYAISMESGDRFPMPILRRKNREKFKYAVISGNHRVGAADTLRSEVIDAYILETTDEQIIELTCRSANRWTGDRQSRDEAIEHAREMMTRFGFPATHMAKVFGINEKVLHNALRAENIRDLLERNLVDATKLPRATLLHLSPIDSNQEVLRQAALTVIRNKMTAEQTKKMAQDIQAARDERGSLQAIAKWQATMDEERPKEGPGSKVRSRKADPRAKLFRLINTTIDFLDKGGPGRKAFMSLSQLRITTPEDKKALIAKFRELKASLKRCIDGEGMVYRANGHSNTAKPARRKAVRRA